MARCASGFVIHCHMHAHADSSADRARLNVQRNARVQAMAMPSHKHKLPLAKEVSSNTRRRCRQDGCTDTPGALLGFAAFKYAPGVGLVPSLLDAFRPVSTAFAIAGSTDGGAGFCFAHDVRDCSATCDAFEAIEADENYVGVTTPASVAQARSRDRLNLAATDGLA